MKMIRNPFLAFGDNAHIHWKPFIFGYEHLSNCHELLMEVERKWLNYSPLKSLPALQQK